jgi:hypothetical protein
MIDEILHGDTAVGVGVDYDTVAGGDGTDDSGDSFINSYTDDTWTRFPYRDDILDDSALEANGNPLLWGMHNSPQYYGNRVVPAESPFIRRPHSSFRSEPPSATLGRAFQKSLRSYFGLSEPPIEPDDDEDSYVHNSKYTHADVRASTDEVGSTISLHEAVTNTTYGQEDSDDTLPRDKEYSKSDKHVPSPAVSTARSVRQLATSRKFMKKKKARRVAQNSSSARVSRVGDEGNSIGHGNSNGNGDDVRELADLFNRSFSFRRFL